MNFTATTSDVTNNTSNQPKLVGWVSESPGRGTWDIITSCFFTIVICTWTVIHPRVHTSSRLARLHKLAQLVKTILAPEMVCLESLQEWIQARNMVKRSAAATADGLKLVHAFYIGMLGLRYRTPHGSRVMWPGQYTWLLNNDLIEWYDHKSEGLSEDLICDKSKADGLVKLAAICQVTWFVLQSITRAVHKLPIAPLETMTLAYVSLVLITYLFWWFKPKDIATVSVVDLPEMNADQLQTFESLAMENVYDDEVPNLGSPDSIAWYLVSRDCSKRVTSDATGSQSHVKGDIESSLSGNSDDSHVITEWDEALYMSKLWPLICILGAAFGALHLISWNSTFPTTVELWLWRASGLASVITSIICMQFRTMSFQWNGPLTIVCVASPVLYAASRFIIMGGVFAALRAMPPDIYDTYVVWNYWFHFL